MENTTLFIAIAILFLLALVVIVSAIVVAARKRTGRKSQRAGSVALPPIVPGYSWMSNTAISSDISPALTIYQVVAIRNHQSGAFKVINPSKLAHKVIEQQTLEQRLALAQTFNHPHCAAVLGSNVRAPIPYFIEEWLGGGSLQDWLNRGEQMTEDELMMVMGQACDGLAYLHACNVVHGAITPPHIRFDDEGRAHIVHCGFARLVSDVKAIHTGDIAMITRSDLYALGIVAYQIATGRLPFEQGQIWSVQQGKQPVPDPRLFNPSLTEACAQAILKALHPDPVQRFQNARDMALAFGFGQEFHRIQDVTRIRRLSQQETRSTKKTRQGRPVPAGPLKLYNPTSGSIITISPPRAIATRELINPTDTLISRTNGEFLFENNSWHLGEVEAAESANGVYLNDARIIEAQPLCIGDKIRLGETVLTVRG